MSHVLLERGLLQLNERVSTYWPQFANAGKQDITVEMVLNHSAGIPAFRDPMEDGIHRDWEKMIARIENEKPFWKPGSQIGYHTMTFGWIVGELIRRVTGKTLGQFFHDEVAKPLSLDFHIGLPDEEEARVSPIKVFVPSNKNPDHKFVETIVGGKQSILYMSLLNSGVTNPNMREDHAAELGAHGAITNARSIAGLFNSLANVGNADIPQLLSRERINSILNNVVETDCDANLKIPTRYSQGFMVSMDNHAKIEQNGNSFRIGPDAFGHVGWGGSAGFADTKHHMAFGYAMNKVGSGRLINSRGQNLIDAAYACI